MPARDLLSARRRALIGASLLAAALGLGFLALASLPMDAGPSQWRGYRSVLVEARVPEAAVLSCLSAAGIKEVVSESTEPVQISDWAGLETLPLSEARARLLPGDPRLDPYLERLGLWFKARAGVSAGLAAGLAVDGAEYRVLYIKEDSSIVPRSASEKAIRGALAETGGDCVFPDGSGSVPARGGDALPLACALAVMLAACAACPLLGGSSTARRGGPRAAGRSLERFAFRLSLALPWAVLAGGGVSAAALAALWASALVEAADRLNMPLDELSNSGSARKALACLALQSWPSPVLFAVAILAVVLAPDVLPSLGIAALGSVTAVSGFALATMRLPSRRRFVPVPIWGSGSAGSGIFPRPSVGASGKARAALACGVLVAWALSRLLSPVIAASSRTDIAFPRPRSVSGSLRPLPSEARVRATSERGDLLPSLASYLEHKAVQEAVPYIRLGDERSDPFAPARLPGPSASGAAVGTGATVVAGARQAGVDFSDEWARGAYAAVPALSVEGMLLRQGSASVGVLGSSGSGKDRPLAPIESLLYIFLLVPPLGRILIGVPYPRGAASGELRQEA